MGKICESEKLNLGRSVKVKVKSESESEKLNLGKISERVAATVPPISCPEDNHCDDYDDAYDNLDDSDEDVLMILTIGM